MHEDVIGSGPPGNPLALSRPRLSSVCPTANRCRAAAFNASSSASSCADPMCSMSRDPRREECTICTALAPEAVFTVPTYGDTPHPTTRISAQIQPPRTANPQVTEPQARRTAGHVTSQV